MLVDEGGSRSSESNFERWRHVIVFTAECDSPGMLKSMSSLLIARLNSLSGNSSHSFLASIFHICFHCILTAWVWYLHLPSVTVDRRQL